MSFFGGSGLQSGVDLDDSAALLDSLSGQDRDLVVRALLKPPAPSRRLRQAANRYKRASNR